MNCVKRSNVIVLIVVVTLLFSAHYAIAVTDKEADEFAEQAYKEALRYSTQNVEMASLYFINALAFNPGRIDIITDYVSMVLSSVKSDESNIQFDMLDAIDNFLYGQAVSVKPSDIPHIVRLREVVSGTREEITSKIQVRKPPAITRDSSSEVKRLKTRAQQAGKLKDYIKYLTDAQKLLENSSETDNEVSEKLQLASALGDGIKQIDNLLTLADEGELKELQAYYLQAAESSLQQLINLSSRLPVKISRELLTVKDRVDSKINEISEIRSSEIFDQIQEDYYRLKEGNKRFDTEQAKINALNNFMQDIAIQSQHISSQRVSNNFKKLIADVQNEIMTCRTEQERKYNRWAVDEAKRLLRECRKVKDTDTIRSIIISHFASIDVRLLNFGANQCFSAVFNEFYQKLDAENKRRVESSMALDQKRSISEF